MSKSQAATLVKKWAKTLTEMPHGGDKSHDFDLRIELYPLAMSEKQALLLAYKGMGVWGYSAKQNDIVTFSKDGIKHGEQIGKQLPTYWEKYVQGTY
jgi:hypothetical protein